MSHTVQVGIRRWDHGDPFDRLTIMATLNQQIKLLYGITAGNLGWEITQLNDSCMTLSIPEYALERVLATIPTITITALSNRRITLNILEIK